MAYTVADIEVDLPTSGLGLNAVLDFLRLIPTSDPVVITEMVKSFVDRNSEYCQIDEDILKRIYSELKTHGRLLPETVIGAPSSPDVRP